MKYRVENDRTGGPFPWQIRAPGGKVVWRTSYQNVAFLIAWQFAVRSRLREHVRENGHGHR